MAGESSPLECQEVQLALLAVWNSRLAEEHQVHQVAFVVGVGVLNQVVVVVLNLAVVVGLNQVMVVV